MVLGKLDSCMQKNEIGPLSRTVHKNQHEMDQRFKYKTWICKTPEDNMGEKLHDIGLGNDFLDTSSKTGNKSKKKKNPPKNQKTRDYIR